MSEYIAANPDWLYTYIDIPNLEEIQKELLDVMKIVPTGMQTNAFYVNMFAKDFTQYTPHLNAFLKSKSVFDKFFRGMFSSWATVDPSIHGKTTKIHVDAYDKRVQYSLNIPLADCSDTYTCWYSGPVYPFDHTKNIYLGKQGSGFVADKVSILGNFALCDDDKATELGRVETIKPMIINTTIPHRAITEKPTRILSCLRFLPELTYEELARFGVYPNGV